MTRKSFDAHLPLTLVHQVIDLAFAEDLGQGGDITTDSIVSPTLRTSGKIIARQAGTVSGTDVAKVAFRKLDPECKFHVSIGDGDLAKAGAAIAEISGNARAILTAERVALNFLGHMSGIATHTRAFVDAIEGTKAKIVDTRKTTPGLRALDKYAVRCGGGMNHRTGLFDAILIKDNHIAAAKNIKDAISAARARSGHMVKIEVEVDTLAQLQEALDCSVDAILLDNMTPDQLKEAVAIVDGSAILEASGGVTLDTIRAIAESGVDLISVGALTHSSHVLDVGLDFDAR